VRWQQHDFAATMQALGGIGFSVSNEVQYQKALSHAICATKPCLIDVLIDPTGYPQQLKAMRG
jgi:acetolactate synthase-1/2/3 large subunit